jgi:hypothetical protein
MKKVFYGQVLILKLLTIFEKIKLIFYSKICIMEKESPKQTPETISAFVNHYQKSRILLTAFELNIFTVIDNKQLSSFEVAEIINTDSRATDRLMNAVCAIGFLIKVGNKFLNTEESCKYFVKGKPDYMDGLGHSISLWDTWTTLTGCVRKGTSVHERPANINDREKEWLDNFISAMHYRASRQAPEIVANIDLSNVRKVLDVGGGSGAFAFAFVTSGENISATVFDLPNVTPLTKKYIIQEKMEGKVDILNGDYNNDTFPSGYDLVFLSAVIHINSYEGNVQLIKKCSDALNSGGLIVIQDQVMDDSRVSPAGGAMFAINMLVGTKEGDTYTENEICEWFTNANIHFEKRINTFLGNALIIGRKRNI